MRALQGHRPSSSQVCITLIPHFLDQSTPFCVISANVILVGNRFSESYPSAHFVKIDVDEVPEVAQELGIRAMPTFLIFKGEEKIAEVVGANPKALEAAIEKAVSETKA